MRVLLLLLCFYGLSVQSQVALQGIPVGGADQLTQVMQTQMTLPKILLSGNFDQEVTVYFEVDRLGRAVNSFITKTENNVLREEVKRMLGFLQFQHQSEGLDNQFVNLHISTARYNSWFKQKNKLAVKRNFPADSSNTVHLRADQSPDYFKNGEDGMEEFLLSELEYPPVAKERSIQGVVIVEFIVETNGYVTNISVKQGVNGGCSEEAIRLIMLTRWQPAVLANKLVRYKTTYPITFNLRNANGGVQAVGQ